MNLEDENNNWVTEKVTWQVAVYRSVMCAAGGVMIGLAVACLLIRSC